jgi:hypothetical protein
MSEKKVQFKVRKLKIFFLSLSNYMTTWNGNIPFTEELREKKVKFDIICAKQYFLSKIDYPPIN